MFLGRAIHTYARRKDIVLTTRVHNKLHDGPGVGPASRRANGVDVVLLSSDKHAHTEPSERKY